MRFFHILLKVAKDLISLWKIKIVYICILPF